MKKKILIGISIALLIVLAYITNITGIPKSVILFQGEDWNIETIAGVQIEKIEEEKSMETSTTLVEEKKNQEKVTLHVNLLGCIPVKEVVANIIPRTKVVPVGNVIGLKLYTNGVLVVGMSEIENEKRQKDKPYENSGIKQGDMIVSINEKEVTCTGELVNTVNSSKGKDLEIKYVRDGAIYSTNIIPAKTGEEEYKLGLWVRDTAARSRNHVFL